MLPMAPSMAKRRTFYRDIQLLLIGVVVLAMAFAEGSANDWLPLLMVDGHGFSPTSGSLIYAGFTLDDRWTLHRRLVHRPLQSRCRGSGQCTNGGVGYWADYFCR